MTSPATKNAWPRANRYHGSLACGFHTRTAITITIGEEIAMMLKSHPWRKPGTKRNAAVTSTPPQI